jgi:hypothetical protein
MKRTMTSTMTRADGLRHLEIASPCQVSWDGMRGDDQVRFCGTCRQNVYNLSSMTLRQAQDLIVEREGHLCVRFFRRTDGTVVTRDCGVAARRLAHMTFGAICGFIALVLTGSVTGLDGWFPSFLTPPAMRPPTAGLSSPRPRVAPGPGFLGGLKIQARDLPDQNH